MPDWIAHLIAAWIPCRLLRYKYPLFNPANTAIVLVGSVLPDAVKIAIPLELLGFYVSNFLNPLHMPLGSILLAGMISLLFPERRIIFLFLLVGIFTHYLLDVIMTSIVGGIYLFFPLSWGAWELGWISNTDYKISLIMIISGFLVYIITYYWDRKKRDLVIES